MSQASLTAGERALAGDLVLANHILAARNILDAFGHVSVRSGDRPDHFLLARNMAPAQVGPDDVHLLDQEGACVSDPGVRMYLERFIHARIYKARPNVSAIVHSHSVSVIPFGIVGECPLRPAYHMSAFVGEGLPIFEIADTVADSDLLIRSGALGDCLAHDLGDANGILMRGHGVTVVGPALRLAVFRSVYLELNAAIQMAALRLGEPRYLSAGEAAAAASSVEGQVDRAWNLWVSELPDASPAERA